MLSDLQLIEICGTDQLDQLDL